MSTKRLAALLVVLLFAGEATAHSQAFFVKGGARFSGTPDYEAQSGTRPSARAATQVGASLWYSNLFRLQGAVTHQGLTSGEVNLQVHPFNRFGKDLPGGVNPYAFVGFGRYFGKADKEVSVVPAGVGVEYPLTSQANLIVEAGMRSTLYRHAFGEMRINPSFMPTVGISYNLNRVRRPNPGEPVFARQERAEERQDVFDAAASQVASERPGAAEGLRVGQEGAFASDTTDSTTGEVTRIPDGTFIMGLTDEDPLSLQTAGRKRVTVSAFYLDKYEVTNAEYRAFLEELSPQEREEMLPDSTVWEETGNRVAWEEYFWGSAYDDYPVVAITYDEAAQFCASRGKRLPTEAEWEYAARADQVGSIYPWPGFEPRNANGRYLANYNPGRGGYAADGYAFTAPVDAYPPNPWGLYNMSGNAAEWVQDAFVDSYSELSDFNPLYEDPEEVRRVVRGGSWASDAFYIGVGVRDKQPKDEASPYIGCRCAMDIENEIGAGGQ